jgi:hypothetical protein
VLRYHADHPHNTVALDDLALIANPFNTSPDFHDSFASTSPSLKIETRSACNAGAA